MPLNNQKDNEQDQNLEEFDINMLEEESDVFDPTLINDASDLPASYAKEALYLENTGGNLAQQPIDSYDTDPPNSTPAEKIYQLNLNRDNRMSNLSQIVRNRDPQAGARSGTYNSGIRGANFERYYAHKDSGLYQKLGFNPYRNNEELYNANSSGYKEWQRANDHWGSIAAAGYKNYFNSYTGAGGNFYADYDSAAEMEKAMAIGSSSMKGTGPAVSNFFLNSGTTFGMLGAFATEGAALTVGAALMGAATSPAGGAGALPFLARLGYAGRRFYRGVKTMRQMNTIKQGTYGVAKTLKDLDNISNARRAWTYVKNSGKFVGQSLNPLQGSMNAYKMLRNKKRAQSVLKGTTGFKQTENVKDWMTGFAAFGEFARDVRAFNMAHSESRLEAGLVGNEVAKNRYNEYYANLKPGENIDEKELEKIRKDVAESVYGTYLANLAVIYTTNKVVFRGIMSPYRNANLSKNLFGRVGTHQIYKEGGKQVLKRAPKGIWAPFSKQFYRPKNLLGNAFRYTSRNWAEGAQELFQEGLAAGQNMYYGSAATSADAGAYMQTLKEGFKTMYSTQGLEVFLSGFGMGGLIGGMHTVSQGVMTHGPRMYSKTARENYNEQKETDKKTDEMLTNLFNDPLEYFKVLDSNPIFQASVVRNMDEAEEVGDKKSFLDFQKSSEFKHIFAAIQNGTLPLLVKHLEGYNDFTDTELKEAFARSYTESEINNIDLKGKINNIIEKAKSLNEEVNYYNENYENPADRDQYVKESPEWFRETFKYAAFENLKLQAMFMGTAYRDILDRKLKIFNAIGGTKKPLKGASITEFNALLDQPSLNTEINTLEEEIAVNENGPQNKDQRKLTANKKKKLEALLEYKKAISKIDAYRKHLNALDRINVNKEDLSEKQKEELDKLTAMLTESSKKFSEKEIEEGFKNIEKAYYKYLNVMENSYNDKAPKNLSAEVFEMIVDYHLMTGEAKSLQLANDLLMSPQGIEKFMNEHTEYLEYLYNRRNEDRAEAKRKFEEGVKTNDIFNELFLAGFYMDPVFYPALKQGLNVKIPFYYSNKPIKSDEAVVENAEDLQKIHDILRKYYEAKGFKVENYPDYIKTHAELNAEGITETEGSTATSTTTSDAEIETSTKLIDKEYESYPQELKDILNEIADKKIKVLNESEEDGWLESKHLTKEGFIKDNISKEKISSEKGDFYNAIINFENKFAKTTSTASKSKAEKEIIRFQKIVDDDKMDEKLRKAAQEKIDELKGDPSIKGEDIVSEKPGSIPSKDTKILKTILLNDIEKEIILNPLGIATLRILRTNKDVNLIPLKENEKGIFIIKDGEVETEVLIVNANAVKFNDIKEDPTIIASFGFSKVKDDVNENKVVLNGITYYVNNTINEWINTGSSQMNMYVLTKREIISETPTDDETKMLNFVNRLKNAKTEDDFQEIYQDITDPTDTFGSSKYLTEINDPFYKLLMDTENRVKGKKGEIKTKNETIVQKNKTMIYNGRSKKIPAGSQVTVLSTNSKTNKATVKFDGLDKSTTIDVGLSTLSEIKAEEPVVVTPEDKSINDESKKVNDDIAGSEVISKAEELSKQGKSLDELEAEMIKKNKENNENCE